MAKFGKGIETVETQSVLGNNQLGLGADSGKGELYIFQGPSNSKEFEEFVVRQIQLKTKK